MEIPEHFLEAITFKKNMFIMVKSTVVRGRLLFLFPTALVWRTGGKPSTWFPPGTRRADSNSVWRLSNFSLQVDVLK